MAVRFLPVPGADGDARAPERGDLAEVIDLRSRLVQRAEPAGTEPVDVDPASVGPADGRSGIGSDAGDRVAGLRAAVRRLETAGGADPCGGAPGSSARSSGAPRTNRSRTAAGDAASADESVDADLGEADSRDAVGESSAIEDSPVRSATEDGVRLLARKARSSGELRRELSALGHDAHEVDATLLEFEGSLYLDDAGLARAVSQSLRERKRASRTQIRMKLRERLLPDGVIEEALAELDEEEELELLRAAAEDRARRLSGLDRQTAERRLLGFLARRGWSGERATRAARIALDDAGVSGARFR